MNGSWNYLLHQNPISFKNCRQMDTSGFRVLIVGRCFQTNHTNSLLPALFPWTVVTLFFPKSGLMLSIINYDFICWYTTTKSLLLCFSDYIVCNCWMSEGLQSLVFIILKWQWWRNIEIRAVHSKDISVVILALNFILTKGQLLKCNMHCASVLLYKSVLRRNTNVCAVPSRSAVHCHDPVFSDYVPSGHEKVLSTSFCG